jgi:HAD superfamily hydrolase (TIGR01509 family)
LSRSFLAAIFGLDGVLTDTASVHARAWKEVVDPMVDEPFDVLNDYRKYVAGRPRVDGIRNFLMSRKVTLPEDQLFQLGEKKNELYLCRLREDGVRVNPEMVARMALYKSAGMKIAVASGSKNAKSVLDRANLLEFGVVVDGNDVEALGLKPKPAPDIFIHAAKLMGVPMDKCIIFEDSEAALTQLSPAHGVLVEYP